MLQDVASGATGRGEPEKITATAGLTAVLAVIVAIMLAGAVLFGRRSRVPTAFRAPR